MHSTQMRFWFSYCFFFLIGILPVTAKDGYQIKISFTNYKEKDLYLGYHLGDKQYIKDTVTVNAAGEYVFQADTLLEGGMYLVVLPSKNFFQILIDDDQQFSIQTDTSDFVGKAKIKGSEQNQAFFDYLNYLTKLRPQMDVINVALRDTTLAAAKKAQYEKDQQKLNDEVKTYQHNLIQKNPKSLLAAIIQSTFDVEMPEFKGDEKEVQLQKYYYTRKHWFDNIDLGDTRLLRTPLLQQKISTYIDKLTVTHPDSIAVALDTVLNRLAPAPESFRYFLVTYLNSYAQSKFVGMDAVYVHLVENYYNKGKASWTAEQDLLKIKDTAAKLKPLLLGKVAPNILMQRRDGSDIALHDIKSDYTILLFWKPDCGHCKKEIPALDSIYNELKAMNVEVFCVCVKLREDTPKCWEFIDEHHADRWLNVVDPLHRSGFYSIYDVQTTPMLYLLNPQKEIISKKLGVHQLLTDVPKIIELDRRKREKTK